MKAEAMLKERERERVEPGHCHTYGQHASALASRRPAHSLVSSALGLEPGSDWQASGLRRSLAGKEWGQSGGFARWKGGERAAAAASRGSSMAAASPANGRWRHCEAERGVADYACAPKRSASHGGSGEGAAGCVSRRRRAARACSSPRPYVRRRGGASASGTGKARVGPCVVRESVLYLRVTVHR